MRIRSFSLVTSVLKARKFDDASSDPNGEISDLTNDKTEVTSALHPNLT